MFRRLAAHVSSFSVSSAFLVLALLLAGSPLLLAGSPLLLAGSPLHAQQPDRLTRADAGLTGVHFGSSTLGDVDGDGTLDLVITGLQNNYTTTTLYLGDGSGGFSEANARGPDLRR